jgi:type I restriction enzyme S subunit
VPEQRYIAETLGALDDKIELNRRMNRTLESIARAIFKSWFVDFDPVRKKMEGGDFGLPADMIGLFPDSLDKSPIGPVPKGWPVVSLASLIELNPTCRLRRGAGAPYVEMAGLPTDAARVGEWRIRPFTSGSRFQNGDVLIARITPCLENGKTALVDFLDEGAIAWGSTEFLVLRPKPPLSVGYVYCLSRSASFRDYAIGSMNGSSGRQRVPVEALDRFLLACPPAPLLERFQKEMKVAVDCMSVNDRESRSLATVRDSLLPRFMAGTLSPVCAGASA